MYTAQLFFNKSTNSTPGTANNPLIPQIIEDLAKKLQKISF